MTTISISKLRLPALALAVLLPFLAPGGPAYAQTGPAASGTVYRVGFSVLEAVGLPEGDRRLCSSIPLAIMRRLKPIGFHFLSPAEIEYRKNLAFERALFQAGAEHGKLLRERDGLPFSSDAPERRAGRLLALEGNAERARRKLDALVPEAIAIPEMLPIALDPEGGSLLEGDASDTPSTKSAHDLRVYGTISYTRGFVIIEMYAYDLLLDSIRWSATSYAAIDDVERAVDELSSLLGAFLAGRPFATLVVRTEPAGALVSIDGATLPPSGIAVFDREGSHTIRIRARGYEDRELVVETEFGSATRLNLALVPSPLGKILVLTAPTGASVYIDSLPAGTTPVVVGSSEERRSIRVMLDGYSEFEAELPADYSGDFPVSLSLPDSGALTFKDAKDQFYDSLGYFVLSLPVPLISFGYFRMYYDSQISVENRYISGAGIPPMTKAERDAAINSLSAPYYVSQGVFWGGAAVSAALLGYAVYRYILYINAAE